MKETEALDQYLRRQCVIVNNILKNISDNGFIGDYYLTICAITMQLLDDTFNGNYDFPIDIDKIAEKFDIRVSYQPLNEIMELRVHKMVGWTFMKPEFTTDQTIRGILIDKKADTFEQRYALAHELAHFLIHAEDKIYNGVYQIMPMLFSQIEEMVTDIFAIFLLIPMPLFLKEFYEYIADCNVPIQTSEWLEHLSVVSGAPYEDVTIGYQNIRYVCCILHGLKRNSRKITLENGESDENKEIQKILDRQIRKMLSSLTDEIEQKLFC